MTTIFLSLFAFIVMVGVLVTFHEFGHFWVARKLGTKVERFSIGFGRPLWSRVGRDGTEYVIAAIPLGGYVKMLDEREGQVRPEERHLAFNNKSVWARIAIVLAGPVFNFILAIFFYWVIFMIGMKVAIPVIGSVTEGSLAQRAGIQPGMEIVQIDDRATPSWQAVVVALIDNAGEYGDITMTLSDSQKRQFTTTLDVANWPESLQASDLFEAIGIDLARPKVPAKLGSVMAGGPADAAGLLKSDTVTHLNNRPVFWDELVDYVKTHPGKTIDLTVERAGSVIQLSVLPEDRDNKGTVVGWLGVGLDENVIPGEWVRRVHFDPLTSAYKAVEKTVYFTGLTFEMIGKLIVGDIALDNISGPVGMAQGAGQTAQSGFVTYLSFLAIVSISLGVMNLLPIPLLDGGHLVFYFIEVIRGKALSERAQIMGIKLGAMMLLGLFSVALFNDISRLIF